MSALCKGLGLEMRYVRESEFGSEVLPKHDGKTFRSRDRIAGRQVQIMLTNASSTLQ